MYQIRYTGQFKKDLKLIKRRSIKHFDLLRNIIKIIEKGGHLSIPEKHRPHVLSGTLVKHWECHVLTDLLLIWLQDESEKLITLVRAGSHSDLF